MPTKTKEINEENKNKLTVKKDTVAKNNVSKETTTSTKKKASKQTTTSTKKKTAKKATTSTKKKTTKTTSATVKKKNTVKSVKKETVSRKKSTYITKSSTTKNKKPLAEVVEYYDLPYRYNETIVKILYQTPDTLFVYWDISDTDRENYIKQYGEDFFNITRPVLIVHNNTMNYSFEIPINDFANSWYLHVNDSKCNYTVELGRRPNYYNKENIKTDYIYVSSSNEIESPNDHVLFNTNENNTIKFRNIKNHQEKSISLYDIIKKLPAMQKVQNIPYIREDLLKTLYAGIYNNEDISLFEKLTNPSSGGNPSSGSMSSRFI